VEAATLRVEDLNDELDGSAELCDDTVLINTETREEERVQDERGRSEEDNPVDVVVGTVVLTDGVVEVVLDDEEGEGEDDADDVDDADADADADADTDEELPSAVPEAVPPRLM